ncbi:MAG: InlB B-repeat-containing protein, partial [Bacteroidales bacterium]|nr:InlB B-repeat-containing protein [Bacteroidales bacterium]
YKFAGWYDNADLEGDAVTQIPSSETGNKEYWAKFERSHSVTFVLNDGYIQTGEIDHYIEGETTALPTMVFKNSASFEGWYTTENFTGDRYYFIPATATEDMTFYAKWGAEKTTFYLQQGPEPVNVLYEGENVVYLDKTTMYGYHVSDKYGNFWGGSSGSVNVPYTGGESTFGNGGRAFNVAQSGFYVFTLTDKGSDSWFISVLYSLADYCTVSDIPDQTYTGSAIEPTVVVTNGETTLTLDTDYTIEYSDNTNAGTATVTITGIGNYGGMMEKTFTIAPKTVTVTADNQTKEYGEADPTLTATVEGLVGDDAVTYTVSREAGEAVGTYAITPTGDASQGNYAVTYVAGTLTITSNPTLALGTNLAPDGNYWTTFYCGDAGYTIDDGENACAYTAKYDGEKKQLTLHKLGKTIAKGEAVIIVADNNEVSMTKAGDGTKSADNDLHGVDVETSTADIQTTLGAGTFYVLGMTNGNFGFHKYTGATMAARKAFVLINGSNEALARSLTMVFDDATGITTVHGSGFTVNGSDAWYSLDGRRLQGKPTKSGVYVNNGKKIVIK